MIAIPQYRDAPNKDAPSKDAPSTAAPSTAAKPGDSEAAGVFVIEHRDWMGTILLEPHTRRLRLSSNGARGSFLRLGRDIEIAWDMSALERFRLIDGRFVHLDLLTTPASASKKPRPSPRERRVAIVTGYFKETRAMIERCLDSVRGQTISTDHIVVSDGFPQDWIDDAGVRHIKLDKSHGDYGNTPRGIGAVLAVSEDYDAIAFLDADNWIEHNHMELALQVADCHKACDVVLAQRNMMRPDGTILLVRDEPIDRHVDTNCFVFLPGSYHLIHKFSLIPRQLSGIGDRIFYGNLLEQKLQMASMPVKTVNYHCLWASLYVAVGEIPPVDSKPNIDQAPMIAWIASLTPEHRALVGRRTGLSLA